MSSTLAVRLREEIPLFITLDQNHSQKSNLGGYLRVILVSFWHHFSGQHHLICYPYCHLTFISFSSHHRLTLVSSSSHHCLDKDDDGDDDMGDEEEEDDDNGGGGSALTLTDYYYFF